MSLCASNIYWYPACRKPSKMLIAFNGYLVKYEVPLPKFYFCITHGIIYINFLNYSNIFPLTNVEVSSKISLNQWPLTAD